MYIFLYLGFNLLNISKTAVFDSYVCGSRFILHSPFAQLKDTSVTKANKKIQEIILQGTGAAHLH